MNSNNFLAITLSKRNNWRSKLTSFYYIFFCDISYIKSQKKVQILKKNNLLFLK